jgi:hypothetical protein
VSEYTVYDFSESLERATVKAEEIESVLYAWGAKGDMAEWEGGFLCALKDGRFYYLTGWCDTTGWGCQDGISETFFESLPTLKNLGPERFGTPVESSEWDEAPADLNRFLRGEVDKWA